MKSGRVIRIKDPKLRRIRNNLRELFLAVVKEKFHEAIDLEVSQSSFGNLFGAQKIRSKASQIYDLLFNSICICHDCRSTKEDAVFIHYSLIEELTYPPLGENDEHRKSFWLCPKCYSKLIEKLKYYEKVGYYYFRDLGTFDTLESLGFESLEEFDKNIKI